MDTRRFERVRFFCPVNLMILPAGSPVTSHSIDISLRGAGIATRARVATGQEVALDFVLKGPSRMVTERVLGRVVRFQAESDGNIVGIEFWRALEAASQPILLRRVMAV
jgi:uncharacterized protein YuzE